MARLNKCIICGSDAEIVEDRGIGDIQCSCYSCANHNPKVYINGVGFPRYHFSGKYNRSKKKCIKLWNEENSKWSSME